MNAGGAFFLLKKILPYYRKVNKGKIFYTGGGLALYPHPSYLALSIGKLALRNLVLGAAESVKSTNIHIATVNVCGSVKEVDPRYNPDRIADEFWKFRTQFYHLIRSKHPFEDTGYRKRLSERSDLIDGELVGCGLGKEDIQLCNRCNICMLIKSENELKHPKITSSNA